MSLLSVRIDTRASGGGPRIPKGQPGAGRFTSAQGAFLQRNRQIALNAQAQVVANIQDRIKRRATSTNRLLTVTAAPGNVRWGLSSIDVGIESFLDRSVAKYWRTIEEGSANVWSHPFIGTQLIPVRTGTKLRTFTSDEPAGWMNGERYVVKHEIAPMGAYRDASVDVGRQAHANVQRYLEEIQGLPILDLNARSQP